MFYLNDFKLNFASDGLAPFMSKSTIDFHYGAHLNTYITNLNNLIQNTEFADLSLTEIIKKSAGRAQTKKTFNNSAQIFNHNFFFAGLARDNGTEMPAEIIKTFGSKKEFNEKFKAAAIDVFGSGWVWLVRDNGVLKIEKTANADTIIASGVSPILVLDVWEHAYYLDHQNRRGDFIDAFLNHLIDWNFVIENLKNA